MKTINVHLRKHVMFSVKLTNLTFKEPMTRSLHTYCTLESTLSRFLLFLELRYNRRCDIDNGTLMKGKDLYP